MCRIFEFEFYFSRFIVIMFIVFSQSDAMSRVTPTTVDLQGAGSCTPAAVFLTPAVACGCIYRPCIKKFIRQNT